jgi:hypothetical protein
MRAALAGLVPVAGQQGTPEIAASALWRYLAEAVWLPTALLPSGRLTWTAVDDRTARATLRDRGATAVADFHFGPAGRWCASPERGTAPWAAGRRSRPRWAGTARTRASTG